MANPRKFSEKIALHNQKQLEETAAFEKIMREVSDATQKVTRSPNLVPTPGLGAFRGGSLPNVSAPKKPEQIQKIDKEQPDDKLLAEYGFTALSQSQSQIDRPNSNGGTSNGGVMLNNQTANPNYRESRGRSVGVGPMRRPADRKIDTSPYSSGNVAYLSPPSDSSWRRTSSDSAIHQSLQQQQDHHHHHHHHNHHASHSPLTLSPSAQRRNTNMHGGNVDSKSFNEQNNHNSNSGGMTDGRPRSSCGLSRLPGINIYPSAHDNSIQIPIGNNTGSLPDLTSVHFPSPLHTPIDQEHDHSSSPYSSSPVTASPSTLSPTSMPTRQQNARFQFSPAHSPGESNTFSPTHSQHGTSQHFLSVPGSNRFPHVNKGTLDNSYQTTQTTPSSQQSFANTTHSNQQSQPGYNNRHHSPPNNVLHGSQGNINNIGTFLPDQLQQASLSGYRSPHNRPSPGSSPGLIAPIPSNSGDSNPSAPCSPAPPGNNGQTYEQFQTNDGYYINHQSVQQHFEQFSLGVDWATLVQSLVETGCTWTAQVQVDNPVSDYISHSPNAQNYTQFDDSTFTHLNNTNMESLNQQTNNVNNSTNLNLSNSNLVNALNSNNTNNSGQQQNTTQHSLNSPNQQQQQQQQQQSQQPQQQQLLNSHTPNTPTSIPEIVFTDFSSAGNEYSTKEHLDLGTMDFVSYQMLSDPSLITDPTIEDSFRQDIH